jgi:hypothetical protein
MFLLLLPAALTAAAGYGVVRVIETIQHIARRATHREHVDR